MSEITAIICGGKPDHEHNDDHIAIELFDGRYFTGDPETLKEEAKQAKMYSVCCSICGSSAFGRDVYYGLE